VRACGFVVLLQHVSRVINILDAGIGSKKTSARQCRTAHERHPHYGAEWRPGGSPNANERRSIVHRHGPACPGELSRQPLEQAARRVFSLNNEPAMTTRVVPAQIHGYDAIEHAPQGQTSDRSVITSNRDRRSEGGRRPSA
jgi:hypothetical protein